MPQPNPRNAQIAELKPQGDVLPIGELMERIIAVGDISQLEPADRAHYLVRVAESAGLNPLTRPFDIIKGQGGGMVLYANKGATDQLRKLYGLTDRVVSQVTEHGIRVVTVEVSDGARTATNIGAVPVENLKGEALANALMKAITKAKRRATLDWCGLGLLDESEIEGMRAAMQERAERAAVPPSATANADPASNEAPRRAQQVDVTPPTPLEQQRLDLWGYAKGLGYDWKRFGAVVKGLKIGVPLDEMTASQVRLVREELDSIEAEAQDALADQDTGKPIDAEYADLDAATAQTA